MRPLDPLHFVDYANLSADEQVRIDDCFVSGAYGNGTHFVVFSRNPELYHVLGVWPAADEQGAVNALNAPTVGDAQSWTAQDKAKVAYTSTTIPAPVRNDLTPDMSTSLFVVEHPCWTEQLVPAAMVNAGALHRRLKLTDVAEMELSIKLKTKKGTIKYRINPMTDALFLTPGAWRLFAAPHYRLKFGNTFVAAMWKYLTQTMATMLRRAAKSDQTDE